MISISFKISGSFAAFRDPSVTSNQTSYYIPSKSAVVGMLGAMIGIKRSNNLGEIYSEEYQQFFKNIKIGLQFESEPKKVMFFTNHRSLKEAKTKPFKKELLENPVYTVYVWTNDDLRQKLSNALQKHEFVYSPYFGHAYCQTEVSNFKQHDTQEVDPIDQKTKCVILDETETYDRDFKLKLEKITDGSVIIERHIHHFFKNGTLDGRVLKHWIPTMNSEFEIIKYSSSNLSKFYKMGNYVVCAY